MKIQIEFTYRTKKGIETSFVSDDLEAKQALHLAEDLERTGRMKDLTFIDQQGGQWTYKKLRKFLEEIQTEPHNITVYFDGGFERSTRKAGLGCAIYYEVDTYKRRQNFE